MRVATVPTHAKVGRSALTVQGLLQTVAPFGGQMLILYKDADAVNFEFGQEITFEEYDSSRLIFCFTALVTFLSLVFMRWSISRYKRRLANMDRLKEIERVLRAKKRKSLQPCKKSPRQHKREIEQESD